jgi:hypothetical protein
MRDTAVGDEGDTNSAYGALIGNVAPGGFTGIIDTGSGALGARHLIEFAFQDAGDRYWLRNANGKVQQVNKHPLDLFNVRGYDRWQIDIPAVQR